MHAEYLLYLGLNVQIQMTVSVDSEHNGIKDVPSLGKVCIYWKLFPEFVPKQYSFSVFSRASYPLKPVMKDLEGRFSEVPGDTSSRYLTVKNEIGQESLKKK